MRTRQFHELEAARRALTFLTATPTVPPLLDAPTTFTQQVQVLSATIAKIDAQAASQTAAHGAITDRTAATFAAAKELRSSYLSPIKQVAKMLLQGSSGALLSPNFAESISVPDVKHYSALLTASSAIAQLVTPYKDLFIARGLPADFFDRLSAQASVLSQAIQGSGVAKRTRVTATADLGSLFQELRNTMRILQICIIQACNGDRVNGPAVLSAWTHTRSVRKTPVLIDIPFGSPVSTATSNLVMP